MPDWETVIWSCTVGPAVLFVGTLVVNFFRAPGLLMAEEEAEKSMLSTELEAAKAEIKSLVQAAQEPPLSGIEKARLEECMARKWQLYIWHDIRADYKSGIGFAVARNVEEAREAIKNACTGDRQWEWDYYKGELMNDPEVRDLPAGDWISGGG
jgi:hypothetical protein